MTIKATTPITVTAATAAGFKANTFTGAPGFNALAPRIAFDAGAFKEHHVITIPLNPLPARTLFRRLELPFDRDRLYAQVEELALGDPNAVLIEPELRERLISEVTDDMTAVLQTAAATGAEIAPYYSQGSEQFTPKAQRMIAQLIVNKLAGREGYSQGAAAEQRAAAGSAPSRKVVRRVVSQLRTYAPEIFEGRTRNDIRSLISAVIVWEAPALPQQIFHGGRLTAEGVRYFRGIG